MVVRSANFLFQPFPTDTGDSAIADRENLDFLFYRDSAKFKVRTIMDKGNIDIMFFVILIRYYILCNIDDMDMILSLKNRLPRKE